MAKRIAFIAPAVLFLVLAVALWWGLGHDPSIVPSALIDKPAPAFKLPPLEEEKPGLSEQDLEGQVSLVNVFASWCLPCQAEHPLLMRLAEDGVTIFGLNYKNEPEDARNWLGRLGDPYSQIGVDLDGRVSIDWGIYGVPETFVVDSSGRIRYKHIGPMAPGDVELCIRPVIERLKEEGPGLETVELPASCQGSKG
ncbi:MAG: DsbE family thiol:disulfide interchange protein [Alphaproteobacteria bacterium]